MDRDVGLQLSKHNLKVSVSVRYENRPKNIKGLDQFADGCFQPLQIEGSVTLEVKVVQHPFGLHQRASDSQSLKVGNRKNIYDAASERSHPAIIC
jgi:hypothetical protein